MHYNLTTGDHRIYTLGLHSVEHKLVMKAEHCMVFYVVGYSLSLF